MPEPDDIAHVFQVPCGPRGGKYTPTVSPQSAERAWYRTLGSNQQPSGQSSAAEVQPFMGTGFVMLYAHVVPQLFQLM